MDLGGNQVIMATESTSKITLIRISAKQAMRCPHLREGDYFCKLKLLGKL